MLKNNLKLFLNTNMKKIFIKIWNKIFKKLVLKL